MRNLKDLPLSLVLWAGRRRLVLGILHLVGEDEQVVLNVAETLWGRLALRSVANSRHRRRMSS